MAVRGDGLERAKPDVHSPRSSATRGQPRAARHFATERTFESTWPVSAAVTT